MTKIVYNPEVDRTKKPAKPEKLKGDPPKAAKAEKPKPEKTEKKAAKSGTKQKRPKANEMEGDVLEFDIKAGLNIYNFIHLPKKAIAFLPFKAGEKLHGHIDIEKQALVITKV